MNRNFYEIQKLPPLFVRLFSLLITLPVIGFVSYSVYDSYTSGNNPVFTAALIGLIILTIVLGLTTRILIAGKRVTKVEDGLLTVHFPPFSKVQIKLSEIAELELREYSARKTFGGWGMRYPLKSGWGTGYIMGGNKGVFIRVPGKTKIFIGSRKAEELYNVMRISN